MSGSRHPQSHATQLPHGAPGRPAAPVAPRGSQSTTAPTEVGLSTIHAAPRLMLAGLEAMKAVAKILPQAHPLVVPSAMGPVELRPGSIWAGRRMLVYAAPLYVWYTIDDRLYEWYTPSFVRDEWLSAMATGAARAEWLIVVAEVEFALLSGIFVAWYVLLAIACAKLGIFYLTHRREVDEAFRFAPKVTSALLDLRKSHPTLFHKLLVRAGKDVLSNIPEGVTAEDVAFFVGRLIKGAAAAAPELTLRALVKMAGSVALLVTLAHLPSITARAVAVSAKAQADELKKAMEAAGFTLTKGEAETILNEALSHPDTKDKLEALEDACKKLAPSTEVLTKLLTGAP